MAFGELPLVIVLPLSKPSDELLDSLKKGPIALEVEQMWKMLGFNGPAVQVQDAEGRPIAIGLEDLLGGLDNKLAENKERRESQVGSTRKS